MAENVWILGIHMTKFGKHRDKDILDLGSEAAIGALQDAGVGIRDVGVLGAGNLMGRGGFGQLLQKQIGQTGIPVYNVSNVSGGLQSKGHPISATGIANIWEIATHLRGEAGVRQIENAKVGLAHVIGLGSACGVHVLERSAA